MVRDGKTSWAALEAAKCCLPPNYHSGEFVRFASEQLAKAK